MEHEPVLDDEPDGERDDGEPLSQSSQIGRAAQTGGTPESRRAVDDEGRDGDRWRRPREESDPIEES